MAKADRRNGSVADVSFGASTVTDPATALEVTALTRIECGLVDGSPDTPRDPTEIDISGLCDRESASISGRIINGMIVGSAYREMDGTDEFWTAFDDTANPPATQTLVVCRTGYTAGTPAAADVCDVYTVQVASRSPEPLDGTDAQRFGFSLTVLEARFDEALA